MLWLTLLLACSTPAPAPTPAHVEHAAGPHAHGAPHGGEVQVAGDLHVEAKLMPTGVMMWLSDAAEKPLAVDGVTATAVVQAGGKVERVSFVPMGDHLHAMVTMEQGKPARVVVTLNRDGQAASATFSAEAVGMAFHDHTPSQGGVVGMFGDAHVELVAGGGQLRFFVSDAWRRAVTSGVSGVLVRGGQRVPLQFDAATGLLSTPGEVGAEPVVLEATVGEHRFSMTFSPGGHPTAAPLP